MYKVTTELQAYFEKKLSVTMQGYISHPYKTRNAAGKFSDLTVNIRASERTSSTSSLDDPVTVYSRRREIRRQRDCVRTRRAARELDPTVAAETAVVSMARRSRRKCAVEMDSLASSGSEDNEPSNGNCSDGSSTGGDSFSCKTTPRRAATRTRIQTRSMRSQRDTSASNQSRRGKVNAPVAQVDKNAFSMTLRVRGALKRKRFYDSEEESSLEEEEVEEVKQEEEENMEEESCSSNDEELARKRACKGESDTSVLIHSERHLRKRPRTKYFEDEDEHI